MKITMMLLTVAALHVSAGGVGQTITFSGRNVRLEKVFSEIRKQTGVAFFYSSADLARAKPVTVNLKNSTLEQALRKLLGGQPLSYIIQRNTVFIKGAPTRSADALPEQTEAPPPINIRGRILDEAGEPVVASVQVKGTDQGATTDANGYFELNGIDEYAVLVITGVNIESTELPVSGRTFVTARVTKRSTELDAAVVIGYGTQKRRDLTGAVASVQKEQISQVVALSAPQAIQGRVAGVDISQNNWRPGAGATVRIRGNRSIRARNDPLYVVDGNPITGDISDINPADIESIEVLKDASATAIYGSRGANGVILVTTTRGRSGRTLIRYNAYEGLQDPVREIKVFNGAEYAEYIRESFRNISGALRYNSPVPNRDEDITLAQFAQDPNVLESVLMAYDESGNYDPSKVRSFDWMGEALQQGRIQNHQLSVSGGTEKTQILASAGYYRNKGLIKNMDFDRYTIRFNLDHEIYSWLKLVSSTLISESGERNGPNIYGSARPVNPLAPIYDENGELYFNPGNDPLTINPLLNINGIKNDNRRQRVLTNVSLEAQITEGLRFRSNFGFDNINRRNGTLERSMSTARAGGSPAARYSGERAKNILLENLLYYDRNFNTDHRLGLTLLQSIQTQRRETHLASTRGLPYESQEFYNLGSASELLDVGSGLEEWRMQSFMARINYGYKGRYLITLTGRQDGASMLAPGHKYRFFPSVALAWRVSDEEFARNASFLSDLKLRLSYGHTGNSSVDPYATQGRLALVRYAWADNVGIGYAPSEKPNPDLTWETSATANLGIDFGFFNNRITGSLELYQTNTFDLIMPRVLPVVSGYASVLSNVGKTRNRGIELALQSRNIVRPGFSWQTSLTFMSNREEITEMVQGKKDDIGNNWFIGHPVSGVYYTERFIGIWQDDPKDLEEMAKFNANGHTFEPGLIRIEDVNGDYRINSDDRVIIGNNRPKWIGSIANDFTFRQFDFSFQLYASYGAMGFFNKGLQLNGRQNMVKVDYWTPERPSNKYPKPNAGWLEPNYIVQTYYQDASFMRVKYATLGYTLPDALRNRLRASQLRVYASVQNPWFFSSFDGLDPEGSQGFDSPSQRTIMLGLNLAF